MTRLSFTYTVAHHELVVFPLLSSPRPCASFSIKPSIIRGRRARKVLALIDPKPLTRQAITAMLAKAFPDWMIVGAANCEQFEDGAEAHLFIIYVRSMSATASWVQNEFQLIKLRFPNSLITILSDREDADDIIVARSAGISGYFLSSSPFEVLIAALVLINAGGAYIPAFTLCSPTAMLNEDTGGKQSAALDHLTASERSVLALLREGKPNKLIALQLNIQESTVKVHVRSILRKLGASNRTHAAAIIDHLLVASDRQLST